MSENIMVSLYYVDRRPIETLVPDSIEPRAAYQQDDPRRNLSMRLRGEDIYGLTPYFTDTNRLSTYLETRHGRMSKEDLLRNADDWYLHYDKHGVLSTFISCTSRHIPGASLSNGRLENTLPGVDRGMCTQSLVIPEYKLNIVITYLRAYLGDWEKIEDRVRGYIKKSYVVNK